MGDRELSLTLHPWPHPSGWFRIRWPENGQGVELVAWIPGYMGETVTRHADQGEAEAEAGRIYSEYRAAVDAIKNRQEAS